MNESERVSTKSIRDIVIEMSADDDVPDDIDMQYLFNAASVLRKVISKTKPWTYTGSLTDIQSEHVQKKLYSFYRWVIQGPKVNLTLNPNQTLWIEML